MAEKGNMELFLGLGGKFWGNKKREKARKNALAVQDETIRSADWEPQYASELVPTFRKAESPVARSYLESLYAGGNASRVNPNAPGARMQRTQATNLFNQRYGPMSDLVARQQQLSNETPWKVATPQRKVQNVAEEGARREPYLAENATLSEDSWAQLDADKDKWMQVTMGNWGENKGQRVLRDLTDITRIVEVPMHKVEDYLAAKRDGLSPEEAAHAVGLKVGPKQR